MQFKSALQILVERSSAGEPGIWLSKSNLAGARKKYVEEVKGYQKSVKIVAGEANSKLFNRPDLGIALREGLANDPETIFMLVFHKDDNIEKAEESFKVDNGEILALKRDFPDKVHIYWSPVRPQQHYAIIDKQKVLLEEPAHKKEQPFWAYVLPDAKQAETWDERFDKYIEYCSELLF